MFEKPEAAHLRLLAQAASPSAGPAGDLLEVVPVLMEAMPPPGRVPAGAGARAGRGASPALGTKPTKLEEEEDLKLTQLVWSKVVAAPRPSSARRRSPWTPSESGASWPTGWSRRRSRSRRPHRRRPRPWRSARSLRRPAAGRAGASPPLHYTATPCLLIPGPASDPMRSSRRSAAGGMGEVYRAKDTRLDRVVAVRSSRASLGAPRAEAALEREARAVSSLSHPHICTLFDVGHHDGVDYLVMEHLDGETLAERLKRGRLPHGGADARGDRDRVGSRSCAPERHRPPRPQAGNVMMTKAGRSSSTSASRNRWASPRRRRTSPPPRRSRAR